VKLLLDQNLSLRLPDRLKRSYPDSEHVYRIGLGQVSDEGIWNYARDNGYTIVTRDADFSDIVVRKGFPPKVIWIRRGNCTTKEIERILQLNNEAILTLQEDATIGILTLF